MGVSDALKDNGKITASKIVEVIYLGILFYLPVYFTKHYMFSYISLFHYALCLGILHQSLVNISYGIIRKGVDSDGNKIDWSYIGTTSLVDRALKWLIKDAFKAPVKMFLFTYYLIPSMVALFVLYRNALLL